jgi:hypothetical protein
MEGRGRGLIWGNIPAFACRDWGKHKYVNQDSPYSGRDPNQSLYEEKLPLEPSISEFDDKINNHKEKLCSVTNL